MNWSFSTQNWKPECFHIHIANRNTFHILRIQDPIFGKSGTNYQPTFANIMDLRYIIFGKT